MTEGIRRMIWAALRIFRPQGLDAIHAYYEFVEAGVKLLKANDFEGYDRLYRRYKRRCGWFPS